MEEAGGSAAVGVIETGVAEQDEGEGPRSGSASPDGPIEAVSLQAVADPNTPIASRTPSGARRRRKSRGDDSSSRKSGTQIHRMDHTRPPLIKARHMGYSLCGSPQTRTEQVADPDGTPRRSQFAQQ